MPRHWLSVAGARSGDGKRALRLRRIEPEIGRRLLTVETRLPMEWNGWCDSLQAFDKFFFSFSRDGEASSSG